MAYPYPGSSVILIKSQLFGPDVKFSDLKTNKFVKFGFDDACSIFILPQAGSAAEVEAVSQLRSILAAEAESVDGQARARVWRVPVDGVSALGRVAQLGFETVSSTVNAEDNLHTWTLAWREPSLRQLSASEGDELAEDNERVSQRQPVHSFAPREPQRTFQHAKSQGNTFKERQLAAAPRFLEPVSKGARRMFMKNAYVSASDLYGATNRRFPNGQPASKKVAVYNIWPKSGAAKSTVDGDLLRPSLQKLSDKSPRKKHAPALTADTEGVEYVEPDKDYTIIESYIRHRHSMLIYKDFVYTKGYTYRKTGETRWDCRQLAQSLAGCPAYIRMSDEHHLKVFRDHTHAPAPDAREKYLLHMYVHRSALLHMDWEPTDVINDAIESLNPERPERLPGYDSLLKEVQRVRAFQKEEKVDFTKLPGVASSQHRSHSSSSKVESNENSDAGYDDDIPDNSSAAKSKKRQRQVEIAFETEEAEGDEQAEQPFSPELAADEAEVEEEIRKPEVPKFKHFTLK